MPCKSITHNMFTRLVVSSNTDGLIFGFSLIKITFATMRPIKNLNKSSRTVVL